MSDVSELVHELRFGVPDMLTVKCAADALETLAGENERLRKRLEVTTADAVRAENEIAKLAPVVEAARKLANADAPVERGGWMDELRRALATLEADND